MAGLLLATGDLAAAFLINAVSFTVIAGVLWTLPPSRAADRSRRRRASRDADRRARHAGADATPAAAPPAAPATRRILGRDIPASISLPWSRA